MSTLRYIRWLAGIEERESHTPTMLKHCVADVAGKHGGDTQRAFAICTASLQKAGELKPGSNVATKKGKAKGAKHAKEPGAEKKLADYEKALAASRKSESSEGASLERHESAPDMTKFFSDPENFWHLVGYRPRLGEWGGGNERPDPKWSNPAAVPPQDSVAQEDDEPKASWKTSVAKESPRPKKGHQYEPEVGQNEAYQTLGQALADLELPTSDGKTRKADPKEFAYRGQHMDERGKASWMHFKHKHTRNHVHLDLENKTVVVPKSRMPFKRGEFDKVENIEVFDRLRLLAGIE